MQLPGTAMSRKRFLKIGGAGALGATLLGTAGCGGDDSSGNSIEWQAIPDYSLQSSEEPRADYIQQAINDWEESSEFTIDPTVSSSNITEANARLLEQASQRRAPDVGMVDSYLFPQFHDFAQPLDDYLEDLSAGDFFPFARQVMTSDGSVRGLQFTTDVRMLYYRTDLVSEPPTTWEELLEVGRGLQGEGVDPFLFPGGRDEATVTTSLLPHFWALGGELTDDEENPIFGEGENRERMLQCLEFIRECVEAGITPQRITEYGLETDLNGDISSGNAAMFLGANFQVPALKEIMGDEQFASRWAVAPIPSMDGESYATTAGGQVWGVFTEDSDKVQPAVDFLRAAFVGDEGMAGWCNVGGYLPPRPSVFETEAYEGDEYTDSYREQLEQNARNRPPSEDYQDISTELQIAVSEVISGSSTPEEALEAASQEVQA